MARSKSPPPDPPDSYVRIVFSVLAVAVVSHLKELHFDGGRARVSPASL